MDTSKDLEDESLLDVLVPVDMRGNAGNEFLVQVPVALHGLDFQELFLCELHRSGLCGVLLLNVVESIESVLGLGLFAKGSQESQFVSQVSDTEGLETGDTFLCKSIFYALSNEFVNESSPLITRKHTSSTASEILTTRFGRLTKELPHIRDNNRHTGNNDFITSLGSLYNLISKNDVDAFIVDERVSFQTLNLQMALCHLRGMAPRGTSEEFS